MKKIIFALIFSVFCFNTNSAIAETYKSKIYSKDDTHIIFQFNSIGNPNKWSKTFRMQREDAKVHCSNYNKNFYFFRNTNRYGDTMYRENLLSKTYWRRFICAKNVNEAKNIINTIPKNFRSRLYSVDKDKLDLTKGNTNDASYRKKLSVRTKISNEHKNVTREKIVDKYFKNKKLDNIEGIWVRKTQSGTTSKKVIDGDEGTLIYIYKDGNKYYSRYLKADYAKKGQLESKIEKISKKYFTAITYSPNDGQIQGDITYLLSKDGFFYETLKYTNGKTLDSRLVRLYPEYRSGNISSSSGKTESSGTAFFINREGHLITNEHVVKGCEDNLKISYQNKNYKVKLISKDEVVDLAILKADLSFNEYFELSDEQPQKLQRVIVAGYPLGKEKISDDLKVNLGIISSLKGYKNNSNLIQIDAAVNFGNSGGPVIDEETSKVVGVAVAGLRKDVTEGFNFAIKSSVVKNFIQSSGVELPSTIFNFSFGTSRDQLRKKTEKATLYIFCE